MEFKDLCPRMAFIVQYDFATDICKQIMEQFNKQDILYMVDGDKTIITQDSYRFCCNGKTKIFDGDFYTGYQSFLFEKELQAASIDKSKIAEITINNEVYDIVASNNYVVLSSGIKDLWSDIANAKKLGTMFASPYISADVKYYVVKQLREHGYTVFAYGDSKIDLYMLREADKGFLYIGKRISRSLKNESLSGLVPIYDHSLVVLSHCITEADGIILGSPTYASNVSGQMKVIIDRGHFVIEQLLYGKYAISVTTYENYGGRDSAKILNKLLSYSGAKKSGSIILRNIFNANPLENIRLKQRIEKVVRLFYRDIVGRRKYMLQSMKHFIVFRIGIQPFVINKGSQYDGVIRHWKKKNIVN